MKEIKIEEQAARIFDNAVKVESGEVAGDAVESDEALREIAKQYPKLVEKKLQTLDEGLRTRIQGIVGDLPSG